MACWPIVKLAIILSVDRNAECRGALKGSWRMRWPHLSECRASCCCQVGPSVVNNHCVLVGVACSFLPHYVLMGKAGLSLTREPKGILLTVSGLKGSTFNPNCICRKLACVTEQEIVYKDIPSFLNAPVFWIKKTNLTKRYYCMYGIWISQTTWNKAFEQ